MKLSKAQREQIFSMFGGKCAYCGCDLQKGWHADHVEPVHREWWKKVGAGLECPERDNIGNLFPSCPPCNIDKHAMSIEGWRHKLSRTLSVLQKNSPTYRHAVRFGLLSETDKPIVFYFESFGQP